MIMKRIINFLISIPLAIIYPSRVLGLFKIKNLDRRSNQILENDNVVKTIAIVAAVGYVIATRYTPAPTTVHQETFMIPLDKILDENYTDFGTLIPSEIAITLSGDRSQIGLFVASTDLRASLNLDAAGPGEHATIFINPPEDIPAGIGWTLQPNLLPDIEIARIEEAVFPIDVFATLPVLEIGSRYRFGEVTVSPEYVTIRGPQRVLDEIDEVLVRFAPEAPTAALTIRHPGIAVAQSHFNQIRGIEFDPNVYVHIEVYERLKTIEIEIDEMLSNVPRNHEIISVTSNIEEIVVWGDFDNMDDVHIIPRISFRDLDDEGQYTYIIQLPPNVYTEIDEETVTEIEVTITVEYEETPEPTRRQNDDQSGLNKKNRGEQNA